MPASTPCANFDLPFPRPEPDYAAKRVRDLSPFAGALAGQWSEATLRLDEGHDAEVLVFDLAS